MREKLQAKANALRRPFASMGGGVLQRKCACGGTPGPTGECEACRKKRESGTLPRAAHDRSSLSPHLSKARRPFGYEARHQLAGRVEQTTRTHGESRSGHSFSRVRVHPSDAEGSHYGRPHDGALLNPQLLRHTRTRPSFFGGEGLNPEQLRDEVGRLGVDLAGVRWHQDAPAALACETFHALAFTVGDHIFAGRRVPSLQSNEGRGVLSHELDHVAQGRRMPALANLILRLPAADVVTELNAKLAANDKPGYFQVLRAEAGAHAASVVVRNAIEAHLTAGSITQSETWRAVCLQVLGGEMNWPLVLTNFVAGVEIGQFTPPAGMPPATSDMLRETAIVTAHTAAAGTGLFPQYQALFNSLWESAPFSGMSNDFDRNLDSKGPRSERSRAIFTRIYGAQAALQAAYDANTGGIRERIDQYIGPDSLNLIASPRLQQLRALFRARPLISSNNPANPNYTAFKNTIAAVAQNLDIHERAEIGRSNEWRLIIDRTVSGATLRADLTEFLVTAWMVAPGGAGGAVVPAVVAPVGHPLVLTADQQTFVTGLNLLGPASPLASNNEEEQLDFTPRSGRNPAGLNLSSRVEVTPAGQVLQGQQTQNAWTPASATGQVHSATVGVDGGAAGFTDFTATLNLVPAGGTIALVPPRANVRVEDQRRAGFMANIRHGLSFSDQNMKFPWTPAAHVEYYGGQQPLSVAPHLNSENHGLTVFARARMSRNGAVIHNFPLTEFGRHAIRRRLGGVTVLENRPPAVAPDNMDLNIEFFSSSNTAVPPFHTIPVAFQIHPGTVFTNLQLLAQAKADFDKLNAVTVPPVPCGGAGLTVLEEMNCMGGQPARISQAIQAGVIKLEPSLVRPDSASYLRAHPTRGNPNDHVAYLVGHTVIDDFHTLVGQPGADAWRWPRFPDSIFINLTPSLANPLNQRPNVGIITSLVHESVHAVDRRPDADTFIEHYKTEFRAYWMEGSPIFDTLSTAFEPTMDHVGPKSARARAIFNHLYGSPTYSWVRPNYDGNINHFREQVNAFIVPDGINLIVSVALENLRRAIEAHTGSGFTAHRANVQTLFALCDATDRREISGNRSWRALVERKYPLARENLIKGDLGIPR